MSKTIITQYYNRVDKLIQFGGSRKELSVRNEFYNLLNHYAEKRNLVLVAELPVRGTKGKDVTPDGTLKNILRLDYGFWESKDESLDLDEEIDKKIKKGYPLTNILFEDSQLAILYQAGQDVMRIDMRKPDELDRILNEFVNFKSPQAEKFEEAIQQFQSDIPTILETLRDKINEARKTHPNYVAVRDSFLELCRSEINPDISVEDVREMLIQHILTSDLFNKVFDDPDFHRHNNIANELEKLTGTLFDYSERRNLLGSIEHYYDAINAAAASVADHHEKQKFLKALYENFYKAYNPKAADRLGVVYTPNEIVDFMVDSTNYLLEKHFKRLLWDKNVEILDPATGTGTFICSIIDKCPNQYLAHKYKKELHANDVAILPYYVANLNIEYTFKQKMGYYEEYKNLCFVDTLDNIEALKGVRRDMGIQSTMFGFSSENAERIKRQNKKKISVVIGNPPYNAKQENYNYQNSNRAYEDIDKRIKATYIKQGTAQNQIVVYDMYTRFYRWAMDRIDKNGVISFITNRSFIDSRTFDGFRKCVEDDFTHCYIIDTKSDVRVNPKIAGTTHNVFGIQTGVAVMFLVKSEKKKEPCKIEYTSLPDEWRKEEKWSWFRDNQIRNLEFERITPDKKHNWLDITENDWDELLQLSSKEAKLGKINKVIFQVYSTGVNSGRDEWVMGYEMTHVATKMEYFISEYQKNLIEIDQLNKIKWSRNIKRKLERGLIESFDKKKIIRHNYRPFFKNYIYRSKLYLDEMSLSQALLGTEFKHRNKQIVITGPSSGKPFLTLVIDELGDYHFVSAGASSQYFPYYRFDEDDNQLDNITDWGLEQFHNHYTIQLPSSDEEGTGVEQDTKTFNQKNQNYTSYKTGIDKIHNNPKLKEFRRELRHNLTPAEASLWKMLQGRKLEGRKFRRQHSVGNYILDFYCPEERLAVELDGDFHFNPSGEQYDEIRTNYLNDAGIRVIRFENKDVFEQTEYVLESIKKKFGRRTTPNPSLDKEGNGEIAKEDIFHYVYAVLHNPAYRKKYELNLKREFPRIPFYEDFWQWAKWGKQLMDLHINYETVEPYPLDVIASETKQSHKLQKEMFAMLEEPKPMFGKQAKVKPKLKADKQAGIIEIDELTFLRGVPKEAWEYKLGNRSALEWVLDQYKEKKPKDPTIAEKFNTYRFADYKEHVIDLLKRVCTVSVETVRVVGDMEKVNK